MELLGYNTEDCFDYENAFYLTSDITRLGKIIVHYELYKMTKELPGHILEFGVFKGSSLIKWATFRENFESPHSRKIVGFDTFEGFRSIDLEHDPEDISEDDFKVAGTLDTLQESISLYDMNRPISHMSRCETVKGDAVETIPEYVKLHPEMTISLLYLDFDLYKPTLVALQNLLPLVCKGGIVALDEFNYDKFAGETAALKEVLDINNIKLEKFTYTPFVAFFER